VAPFVIGTGTTEIVPLSVASTDPPTTGMRLSWLLLHQLLLSSYSLSTHILSRSRPLHLHEHLQRVSATAQSQRKTLLGFCSLRVPLHLTRLLPFHLWTLCFWLLMPKGEREYVVSGAATRGFWFFCVCVLLSCIMFTSLHLHCMIYVLLRYSCDMLCFIVFILFHVTCLVFSSYALLPCSTAISYELYYHVLISFVLSYEYIMLAWNT
jgi:hypothetical protein